MTNNQQAFEIALDQPNLQALARIVLICVRQQLSVTALAFQRQGGRAQITLQVQCGEHAATLLEQLLLAVREVMAVRRS